MTGPEFIDALRECLGLAPIGGDPVRTEAERFGGQLHTICPRELRGGMTPRVGPVADRVARFRHYGE